MIKTRIANLNDIKVIVSLMSDLGYKVTGELIDSKLRQFEKSDTDIVYVAEDIDTGEILGAISLHLLPTFHAPGYIGRITSLIVSTENRGSGVGTLLMDQADKYFIANGCLRAEVTSGDERQEAHRFYEKHNFTIDERRFIKRYNI